MVRLDTKQFIQNEFDKYKIDVFYGAENIDKFCIFYEFNFNKIKNDEFNFTLIDFIRGFIIAWKNSNYKNFEVVTEMNDNILKYNHLFPQHNFHIEKLFIYGFNNIAHYFDNLFKQFDMIKLYSFEKPKRSGNDVKHTYLMELI